MTFFNVRLAIRKSLTQQAVMAPDLQQYAETQALALWAGIIGSDEATCCKPPCVNTEGNWASSLMLSCLCTSCHFVQMNIGGQSVLRQVMSMMPRATTAITTMSEQLRNAAVPSAISPRASLTPILTVSTFLPMQPPAESFLRRLGHWSIPCQQDVLCLWWRTRQDA